MTSFSRRGLHGQIVEILGRRIVSGDIAIGEVVDVNELVGELQVSRTVVRETVKVLIEKGLLDARPRIGTFVRDRSEWNLLDSDVIRWRDETGPDARLLRELEEVRLIIEPSGARLAAQLATPEQVEAVRQAMDHMVANADADVDVQARCDLEFHQAVLSASGNELLARLELVLGPAILARSSRAFTHYHNRHYLDSHRSVLDAIEAKDAKKAGAAMESLLRSAQADTSKLLEGGTTG